MEINNQSALLDEDELVIEGNEDDEFEEIDEEGEFDEEEYNFNDEEEGEAPSDDEDEESATSEDHDEGQSQEVPAAVEEPANTPPTQEDATSDLRQLSADLLVRLGYHGTYEEALAAYRADVANQNGEATPTPPQKAPTVDYQSLAKDALREINAEFGLTLTDFNEFDNVDRFAALLVGGATAVEAYRATQKAVGAAPVSVAKPSRDHLKTLPEAGAGGSVLSGDDRKALATLRELYPERSVKDLRKTLERVKRARS